MFTACDIAKMLVAIGALTSSTLMVFELVI